MFLNFVWFNVQIQWKKVKNSNKNVSVEFWKAISKHDAWYYRIYALIHIYNEIRNKDIHTKIIIMSDHKVKFIYFELYQNCIEKDYTAVC